MTTRLHILYIYIVLLLFGAASPCYGQGGVDPEKKVQIFGNVYGGGELAQVETPDGSLEEVLVTDQKLNDGPKGLFNPAAQHTYTTYVRLGENADIYGQSFGGGKGHSDAGGPTAGRVIGQTDLVLDGATVWSELYGGGQMADVRGNTLLHFKKGKAGHNAFGGGLGKLGKKDSSDQLVEIGTGDDLPDNQYTPWASADIRYIGRVTNGEMDDAMRTDLPATGNTFVVFDGSEDSYTHYEFKKARKMNLDSNGKLVKIGDLYYTETDQYNPANPSQLFSINHNIYGGGMTASVVEGNTYVHIRYGMVSQEMMDYKGGGTTSVWSQVYKSIANAQFCVFGGGYGYHSEIKNDTNVTMDVAGSGRYTYINEFTDWFANQGKTQYHWDTNTGTPEDIYNAADNATWSHGAPGRSAMDIVGGGYNGRVLGTTHIETSGDLVVRKVYGGGYYASVGNTEVTLKSGIYERVYGGGMIGNVYGKATLNFGQKGNTDDIQSANLHLMVKDAIYGGNDVSGAVGTTKPGEKTHTNPDNKVTYNIFDPVDDDDHGVRLNIYGGLVLGDVYGAGNGNHPGYSNPNNMDFNLSQHPSENYRKVIKEDTDAITPTDFAFVYKYRPRTARVIMNIEGNDGINYNDDPQVDKVRIWGRTFGGGNSCNVGLWDGTADDNKEKYSTGSDSWHPGDNFLGGGTIQINIGDHVQLGNSHNSHDTPNGLFLGCNGEHLVTQHTDKEKSKYYHQYYDITTRKYWPGFEVYEAGNTNHISREAGLKAFRAFINNITTWTDNVTFDIKSSATDVWFSNFVGGGFRGSMKKKTAGQKFAYTLPENLTIGHNVVGGAFNAHIFYRIYATTDGHTYKTFNDNYRYEFDAKMAGAEGVDYRNTITEKGPEGTDETHYVRYNYDGGLLSANGNLVKDFCTLDIKCKFDSGARVFGGCFSSGITQGDVTINYEGTGADEVYGGGEQAEVQGSTSVNLLGGSLGSAYGGGLGSATEAAYVNGNATVTLDGSVVNGSIFGANNVNGTPKGHVKVHVLKTKPRAGQDTRNTPDAPSTFDVLAVYGGGNKAAYEPTESVEPLNSTGTPKYYSEVLIENCDNSIAYVYGGGNAAPVPATEVTIYGADAIDYAFAGGNGEGDGNPGADIGYLDYFSTQDPAAKEYGVGTAVIYVYGGTINNVYGGSNTLGYVREHAYVRVREVPDDYTGSHCDLKLGHVHAGGNKAEMFCGGSMELACTDGADVVYAGSNNADIHGDIDLVISSGTYGKVFGGNNTSGGIYGHINIDIDETGCWPVIIGELYGCGNNAPYSVYGYAGSPSVPRDKAAFDALDEATKTAEGLPYADPVINIISCTEIGKIFGGGNGVGAIVYGNPTVNINTIKGIYAGKHPMTPYILDKEGNRVYTTEGINIPNETARIGDVYGGGNAAPVFGNTRVNIGTQATNQHVSGTDQTTEKEVSVVILGNVFGGSKGLDDDPAAGRVTGTTKVIIGDE